MGMSDLTDEELKTLKAEIMRPQSLVDDDLKLTAKDLQKFTLGCALTIGLGLLFVGLCLALVVLAFKAVLG